VLVCLGMIADEPATSRMGAETMKRFFKISEAVEYCGLSRSSLYDAHKRGDLEFTKFGSATRIEKSDLDGFLDRTATKAAA